MNVMVVGGGGREHALLLALRKNPRVKKLYALPGNGGIAEIASCAPIAPTDIDGMVRFACEKQIDFAVVAPDNPLVLGAVDALEEAGIPCFGPDKRAAIIEGSKSFAKELMKKHHIPTAQYEVFDDMDAAIAYVQSLTTFPVVVKADGLALGKGVVIANTCAEAEAAIYMMMQARAFGESGTRVVIEEFLRGPEVSVLAFTDGHTLLPLLSSMDHKRALDGDKGENTGGMGAVAPNPYYTEEMAARCMREIFMPTIRAMEAEGRRFRGCLYFGLMLTERGPMVIEYNCRFGDPETQAVLPLMQTDLLETMQAVRNDRLHEASIAFLPDAACCVVLASGGYPGKYETNKPISIENQSQANNVFFYHAGTARREDSVLCTSGGRVMGVTATGKTLADAVEIAYRAAKGVQFEGMHMRSDIGRRALDETREGGQYGLPHIR
ncbi:phosphoribosylamine--glycine ligase [Christensenellaceae bacterium OttesenSCG-928-L17]|nr:phosphoribosylamine--glycine ligase [Christensenellaceae bacterium OttesenSCG-928-L17]